MLSRYPHTAQLIQPVKVSNTDNGMVGTSKELECEIKIYGRLEQMSKLDLGYRAKFYIDKSRLRENIDDFEFDGAKIICNGMRWEVVRIIERQVNTVAWLK